MFFEVSCNEHRIPVELTATGGRRKVLLDGREIQCDWVALPNGQYSIILDGRVFDLSVEVNGETCSVVTRDAAYVLKLADRRRLSFGHGAEGGQAGFQRIRADMPGKVVRILVSVGDPVKFDQGLLVLEAMKMQNEIRAPKSGVVKEIGVEEGKAVNSGDLLISLE